MLKQIAEFFMNLMPPGPVAIHVHGGSCVPGEYGISPVEYKVLVKPSDFEVDPVFKRAAEQGIKLPAEVVDRELAGQIDATLIATGGNAFSDWKPPIPQPGQRVLIAKYAGISVKGADGVEYRMLNDKDISGIITREGVSRV